jgi:hypothetical protein
MVMGMREKLIEVLRTSCAVGKDCHKSCIECTADHMIANDVVPVVRCKDFWNCTKSMWCNLLMMNVEANDFCSHGKRRKDNDSI